MIPASETRGSMMVLVCNDDVSTSRDGETLNRGGRETYKCGETCGESAGTFSEIDTTFGERRETLDIIDGDMREWQFMDCWTI